MSFEADKTSPTRQRFQEHDVYIIIMHQTVLTSDMPLFVHQSKLFHRRCDVVDADTSLTGSYPRRAHHELYHDWSISSGA